MPDSATAQKRRNAVHSHAHEHRCAVSFLIYITLLARRSDRIVFRRIAYIGNNGVVRCYLLEVYRGANYTVSSPERK